ncbi:hypothetical protein [Micromonospora sp. WMMD1082]|uniref:hypothetical protein n=1 Tax=Micromonospora sp. WMMD1082 TaxID=3016104 RepID=UPI0024172B71|nr:hypothetical protein [Micromonospora sp. WMMD1082]MDG4796083.1 hypothetical protein [Micromonospora sp. WMMD1082]
MLTFPVDEVIPATESLPTRPLGELFGDPLVSGGDPALPTVTSPTWRPVGSFSRLINETPPTGARPNAPRFDGADAKGRQGPTHRAAGQQTWSRPDSLLMTMPTLDAMFKNPAGNHQGQRDQ